MLCMQTALSTQEQAQGCEERSSPPEAAALSVVPPKCLRLGQISRSPDMHALESPSCGLHATSEPLL